MTPEPEWIDGPKLYAFLCANGLKGTSQVGSTLEKRVRDWREGDRAHYSTADAVLTKLEIPLAWITDDMWTDSPRRGKPLTKEERTEILERAQRGEQTVTQIARAMGCGRNTVVRYLRDLQSAT